MWAYYAADHHGVAIGFDETHPFFAGHAEPINYSDTPVSVSTNDGWVRLGGIRWDNEDILNGKLREIPRELIFRKTLGWGHEKEWRMVAPLARSKKTVGDDDNGYPVHLFEVPPPAVLSIMFGHRAREDVVESTTRQITSERRWDHLRISRRWRLSTGRLEEETLR